MGIKLKHGGAVSGGASGRKGSAPQTNDASRVDVGGHFITAPAVTGRASAPSPGGGGGGGAHLVGAPGAAPLIHAPAVSGAGGGARQGRRGVRSGGAGSSASAGLPSAPSPSSGGLGPQGGNGRIVSIRSETGYGPPPAPPPEFEVTGYDPNVPPDRYSVWNEQTQQWERGRVAYGNWQGALSDDRKFTEAQRREVEQLNAVYERARKSGRYTPEELTQIGGQIEERKRAIQPLSSLPEESAQAGFDKRIVTAPGGQKGYLDSRGNFIPLPGSPSDVTPEMWNQWRTIESKVKVMGKDEKGEDVLRDRTPQEIAQAVADREAEFKKKFAPPPETPAAPAAPQPGQPGTITITQGGKKTTTTVDDIMRDPKMIENLKEHWSVGEGMSPKEGDFSFVGPVRPKSKPTPPASGGGEYFSDSQREMEPPEQGLKPPAEGGESGGESAPPPKKEKKEDE